MIHKYTNTNTQLQNYTNESTQIHLHSYMSFAVGQRSCQVWPHGSSRGPAHACILHFFLQLSYQNTFPLLFYLFSHTEILVCLHTTLISVTLIYDYFSSTFLPFFSSFLIQRYKYACILHFFLQPSYRNTFTLLFSHFSLLFSYWNTRMAAYYTSFCSSQLPFLCFSTIFL